MNTKLATREIRLREWMNIFEDRASTDLSIEQYCEEHGLSRNSYYYWLRMAKTRVLEESNLQFVEISNRMSETPTLPAVANPSPEPMVTMVVNGISIQVTEDTSKTLLSKILEVALHVK